MPGEHESRPDVLVSGGDDAPPPRRLPPWLRRGASVLVVLAALTVLALRVASDERRRQVAVRAADQVDAVVRISEAGIGAGGTVVVGVQVLGQGSELRVDRPQVRPSMLRVDVVGTPVTVAADRGNQVRLRLLPRCADALTLTRVDIDLPITPASGHRHVRRVRFPNGPDLVRRACGYLPPGEALTVDTAGAEVAGPLLRLTVLLRNDGLEPLTVTGVDGPGPTAVRPAPPVPLPPRGPSVAVRVDLRVTDCAAVPADPAQARPLTVRVLSGSAGGTEVQPSFVPVADRYRAWRDAACR